MAISDGTVVEAIYTFSQVGIEAKMIQFYRVEAMPPEVGVYDESRLATNLQAAMIALLDSVLPTAASFISTRVINRTNPLFEGISSQPVASGAGGTALNAPFVAISVFQQRATRATRNGYKRIPFPAESKTAGGIVSLTVAERDAIEDFFGGLVAIADVPLFFGDILLQNVIIPRVLGTGNIYTPDYDNPNDIEVAVVNRVTSQVSRKS